MSKRLGGIIGCKDKTSSWHLIMFRSEPLRAQRSTIVRSIRTQSKTFGAHLSLKTRLNRFFAVFAYRIVLICRATPASHAPRLALSRELQMWKACSTPTPASNKSCIFTKVLHLSEVNRRSELSHPSDVRSRQSTTSHNIIRLLRSQFFLPETKDEVYYRPRDCDMSQESQLLLDEQFRGTNVITLRSPITNSLTSSLSGTHVMTL